MNRTLKALLALSIAVLIGSPAVVAQTSDPVKLIQEVQDKINVEALDLTSTFTLVQKKDGEADRVLRLKIFRRDRAGQFTLLFQYPDSEKGKGYYRNVDDLFLYLPSTREFVHRNRKDDVGSTDVRTDVFGKQDLLSQYTPQVVGTAKIAQFDTTVVELTAKTLDVAYPVQKWYLRSGDNLPVKVENYSASKTLLRTTYYVDFKQVAPGKYLFTKLMAVDNLAKNQKTLLSNDDILTTKIADYTFSQAFLEEQSR